MSQSMRRAVLPPLEATSRFPEPTTAILALQVPTSSLHGPWERKTYSIGGPVIPRPGR
jgi:hypothetical protein